MKEYREATGMVAKPEPLPQVNMQQNFSGNSSAGRHGISSAEDLIRLLTMTRGQAQGQSEPGDGNPKVP